MRNALLVTMASAALMLPSVGKASVTGYAYLNSPAGSNAVIGFAHGAPDAVFTVPSPVNPACTGIYAGDTLCFNSNTAPNGYTLGGFLATSGATILSATPTALATTLGSDAFEFVGTVSLTNGQTFQAGHDDGLQLQVGTTLVIDAPGPTAFTTTPATYNGPTGTFNFDLVFGECCSPPANLDVALPFSTPVPEPASLAVVGLGVLGVGAIRWQFAASKRKPMVS